MSNKMFGEKLENLATECAACNKCELASSRTNIVFGSGNDSAQVMFIGEAPGKNEDLRGEPFVGAAGKLLNELLCSIGLERKDIYIANILKCRPPKNRNPKSEEVELCTPWLQKQIGLIKPAVIVTLGNFPTRFILQTKEGITALHGKVCEVDGFCVLPMFHPAAAIYDRKKIESLRTDFALLKDILDNGLSHKLLQD